MNWIDLFVKAAGKDEVPPAYYLWAGISTFAAALENKVWMEWLRDSKVYPNMYIMFIGPSGTGKNVALDRAYRFVRGFEDMNIYRGRATIQYLLDYMGTQESTALYLMMPELSANIGTGPRADEFIRITTDLYSGNDYYFQEGTRTSGGRAIKDPCLNLLCGTTREWLISSVPLESIRGGFFARIIAVEGQYDYSRRIWRPEVPPNYDDIMWDLFGGLERARTMRGPMYLTDDAEMVGEQWYMGRPGPEALLEPSWHRQRVMMFKLAMIFAIAEKVMIDEPWDMSIPRSAVIRAQKLIESVSQGLPNLLSFASTNGETRGIQVALEMIKSRRPKRVTRSELLKRLFHYGINTRRFQAEVLPSLLTHPRVRTEKAGRGQAFVYEPRRIIM